MTYYNYKLNRKMVQFLASEGYDMLVLLQKNRGGLTTGDLARQFNKMQRRSKAYQVGRLSYYLRQSRSLGLTKLMETEYHIGFRNAKFKRNLLTEFGISVLDNCSRINDELIGITSTNQIKFTLDELTELMK